LLIAACNSEAIFWFSSADISQPPNLTNSTVSDL
jgi:hypothetical protein